MESFKTKKKKIKGQIPGTHYSWLVALAHKRHCQVSDVLAEIVVWITEEERTLPFPVINSVRSASGSHTSLNFNADEPLLAKWERFKEINGITGDSHAIRVAVSYRYGLSAAMNRAPTRNGKPIHQQEFTF